MADDGFARTYGVELMLENAPKIDKEKLLASLRRCEQVEPLGNNPKSLSFTYSA